MTRVLLVDDHPALRAGVASVLATMEGVEVVGESGTAEDAVSQAARLRPDLVILDHQLPGMSGVEACEPLLEAWPRAHIIVLTQFPSVELRRRALRAGARGFVVKTTDAALLQRAVRAVAAGERFVDRDTAGVGGEPVFTSREVAALECLARGLTTAEAGHELGISPRTVQEYVNTAMQKLGVSHRAGAVAEAVRRGLA